MKTAIAGTGARRSVDAGRVGDAGHEVWAHVPASRSMTGASSSGLASIGAAK